MFAKLLLIILFAGAIACCLLAIRQQRIESAHEMWQVHHRLVERQHMLWDLRRQVFRSSRPEVVRKMLAAAGGQWTVIPEALDAAAAPQGAPQPSAHRIAARPTEPNRLRNHDG